MKFNFEYQDPLLNPEIRPNGRTITARFSGNHVNIFTPHNLTDHPTMVFRRDDGTTIRSFDMCKGAHHGIAEHAANFGLCLLAGGLQPFLPAALMKFVDDPSANMVVAGLNLSGAVAGTRPTHTFSILRRDDTVVWYPARRDIYERDRWSIIRGSSVYDDVEMAVLFSLTRTCGWRSVFSAFQYVMSNDFLPDNIIDDPARNWLIANKMYFARSVAVQYDAMRVIMDANDGQ